MESLERLEREAIKNLIYIVVIIIVFYLIL